MNWRRITALLMRYGYLYRRSPPRIMEIFFWPVMDLLVWGFLTRYLLNLEREGEPLVPSWIVYLIGAMIFWDILYRAQQGVTLAFLEDIWSRNLLNLFAAPLKRSEFITATFCLGFFKITVNTIVLTVVAYLLYQFNLMTLGFYLVPFILNLLLFGWAIGMTTTALILRWGQSAEALAWGVPFLIQPLAAVFYPISVLPAWVQPISRLIPSSYVFEGMRTVMRENVFSWTDFAWAAVLNVIYLVAAALFFRWMFGQAQEKGLLVKLGTQ